MLKNNTFYQDLGAEFHDFLNPQLVVRRAIDRIERLGYKVTVNAPALAT